MSRQIINETTEGMENALEYLKSELLSVRTGRASLAAFENIQVEAYGAYTPLNGVGSIHIVDAHLVTIQPWDISIIRAIEKAIMSSTLGYNPSNDGKIIRIPIPALTEERRKELVKVIKKMSEEGKVAIRNIRREGNDKIKSSESASDISEDEARRLQDEVQKLTDKYIEKIDEMIARKEKDLMEI